LKEASQHSVSTTIFTKLTFSNPLTSTMGNCFSGGDSGGQHRKGPKHAGGGGGGGGKHQKGGGKHRMNFSGDAGAAGINGGNGMGGHTSYGMAPG
jgi:fibronectin-binding autotransporter adhesin